MNNSKIMRFVNHSFVITTVVAVVAVLYLFLTQDNSIAGGILFFGNQLENIIEIYIMGIFTPLMMIYITGKEYERALTEQRVTHFFTSLLTGILTSAGIGIIGEVFLLVISNVFKTQCHGEFCEFGLVLFFIAPLVIGSILAFILALLFYFLSQRHHIVNRTITEPLSVTNNHSAPKSRVTQYLFLFIVFIIIILAIRLLLWLTFGASHR